MLCSLLATLTLAAGEPSAAGLAGRFVEVQQALPGEQPNYETWTQPQLEAQLRRLEEKRPGIGLPITLIAVGGGLAIIDSMIAFFGGIIAAFSGGGFDRGFVAGTSVVGVLGIGLVIVGVILLRGLAQERGDIGREIDRVKAAIEHLTPAPPEQDVPRPPASETPFPQQVMGPQPWFVVTLARF